MFKLKINWRFITLFPTIIFGQTSFFAIVLYFRLFPILFSLVQYFTSYRSSMLQFALVLRSPIFSEFSFKGIFKENLAINLQLLASGFETLDSLIQLGKQLLNLRY